MTRRDVVVTLAVLVALAGCSAGDDGSAVGGAEAGDMAVEAQAQADVVDTVGGGRSADQAQQVIQTARVTMTAPDPVGAAHEVVTLVERLDGRVDARHERTGAGADDPGSASLTLRVPSAAMSGLPDDLREIGTVQEFQVESETVTAAAQDLDARITATELSVARMSDLLARATTSSDVIAAEAALTERQANLEQLRSERARLADRVALSTVEVEIWAPEQAPEPEGPQTFLDGLRTGWDAFVATVRGALVVLGVLLPWLLTAGAVTAGVMAWRRRRARPGARPDAGPTPPPTDGSARP